jgi:pimeloyl-ACP methyl ester carboxylesterase
MVDGLDRPSQLTAETLKRHELERQYRRDPEGALTLLERRAAEQPSADLVFALAELSWIDGKRIEGRRIDRRRGTSAVQRYVDTVAYSWDFLFDPALAASRQPSDPRYQLACSLYKGGLERLLRAAKTRDRIQPGDTLKLTIHGQEQSFPVTLRSSPWSPGEIHDLLLASDFTVSGLDSRTPQYGLGVPLIGIRRSEHAGQGEDRFFAPETAFPLTAILRPTTRERDGQGNRPCTLDLIDPLGAGPEARSLESDVTTPLAYMWSRTDLSRYRWTGLLRPGEAEGRAGLMLLRPYDPNKIPVVMVHGLASSPLAWIPMLNELMRDPAIHQRFQFLLYVYPTGVPVPIAASGLRDALLDAKKAFDAPSDRLAGGSNFDRMVLLGHSMGGLLSHAVAVDSGNAWWQLNTDRSFRDILGPPEVLKELQHYSFFEALPFVRRVVFLATPHRGSDYARRPVGRISSSLISEPDRYTKLLGQLVKDNRDAFPRQFRHLPTSIDTLWPDSEVLLALLKMTPGKNVQFHSIIGSLRPSGVHHTTDGVVPYRSSHLDGVASEYVVRSNHGVQQNHDAIREVRRILLEHLRGAEPNPPEQIAGPAHDQSPPLR